MDLKKMVYGSLVNAKGRFVSGETLSVLCGVSRTAIWKAVQDLRNDGVEIVSRTNEGYALRKSGNVLTELGVREYLKTNLNLRFLNETDSTNNEGKVLAVRGEEEGTVVIAKKQTGGKGRQGRKFFSPPKCGVYFSILVRPSVGVAPYLTVIAACAVKSALEEVSEKKFDVKWVNDVYLDGKKCCGILTEATMGLENGGIDFAVVGIGINVTTPKGGYPKELKSIATAACDGVFDARNRVLASVLDKFFERYELWKTDEKAAKAMVMNEYASGIEFMKGKKVVADFGNAKKEGVVRGVDEDFHLLLETESGVETLFAGDVHLILE